jgi:hypothetical protein
MTQVTADLAGTIIIAGLILMLDWNTAHTPAGRAAQWLAATIKRARSNAAHRRERRARRDLDDAITAARIRDDLRGEAERLVPDYRCPSCIVDTGTGQVITCPEHDLVLAAAMRKAAAP